MSGSPKQRTGSPPMGQASPNSAGYGHCVDHAIEDPSAPDETVPGNEAEAETLDARVIAELEAILLAQGPLLIDELCDTFAAGSAELAAAFLAEASGADLATSVTSLAQRADEFWRIPDGRIAPVLYFLRRSTFTHRLTAEEIGRDAVDLSPDLVVLALPRSFRLANGTELQTVGPNDDARAADGGSIVGPPGWLATCGATDLVVLRYDGEEVGFEPISVGALADADATREALQLAFASLKGTRAPEVHRLVVETLGGHPKSFAVPVAPLRELLNDVGLAVRGAWVGLADTPWQTPPEQARRRRLEELLSGADDCCQKAARGALAAWHGWLEATEGDDPSPGLGNVASIGADVDHGPTAALLAEVATIGRPLLAMRHLGQWAGAIAVAGAQGGESSIAGLEYLQALGADAAGEVAVAEAHVRAGLSVTPEHPACLGLLAEFSADRGDAAQAAALLRRVGRPLLPEMQRDLAPFLQRRQVGRNDPCPCGSGRKYKACCLHHPAPRPLVERCRWLLSKATRYAGRTDPMALESLGHLFDASNGGDDAARLALDMLLFATPGLARYLEARGELLPADELVCAQSWLAQPMRLLEIQRSGPAGVIDAVDQASGQSLSIVDEEAAARLSSGDIVVVRALPSGDVWLLSSALIPVPPGGRDRALEMVREEVRPLHILQFIVDLQVDAMKAR